MLDCSCARARIYRKNGPVAKLNSAKKKHVELSDCPRITEKYPRSLLLPVLLLLSLLLTFILFSFSPVRLPLELPYLLFRFLLLLLVLGFFPAFSRCNLDLLLDSWHQPNDPIILFFAVSNSIVFCSTIFFVVRRNIQ